MIEEPSGRPAVDTPRVLEELSRNNAAASSKHRKQRQRILLMFIILTPLLIGVAYTSYNQWRVQATVAGLKQETDALTAAQQRAEMHLLGQISRMSEQLGDLTAVVSSSDAVDEELLARLEEDFAGQLALMQESLSGAERQLHVVQSRDEQWIYVEVAHLLRQARQKLQMDANVDAATGLLRHAHALLEPSNHPSVLELRQQIAQDLRSLEAISVPDIAGAYVQLAAFADATAELSLVGARREAYAEQLQQRPQGAHPSEPADDFATAALELLGSIFVWREWDEVPIEILPPQQEYQVRQSLQLLLEQAQLALLMREQAIFVESLERSRQLLSRHGLQGSEEGRTLIAQLDDLMTMSLRPEVPDITDTVLLARQMLVEPGATGMPVDSTRPAASSPEVMPVAGNAP